MSKSMIWINGDDPPTTASRMAWLAAKVEKRDIGKIPEKALWALMVWTTSYEVSLGGLGGVGEELLLLLVVVVRCWRASLK